MKMLMLDDRTIVEVESEDGDMLTVSLRRVGSSRKIRGIIPRSMFENEYDRQEREFFDYLNTEYLEGD
jgi:hypothetical protein